MSTLVDPTATTKTTPQKIIIEVDPKTTTKPTAITTPQKKSLYDILTWLNVFVQ